MTPQLAMVLGLLGAAVLMFALNRPRMDAVALIVMTALPFTGVLSMSEALTGFSDSNIVLIAALFVIGDGLVRTGVARQLGDWLSHTAGSSEVVLVALLMTVVCGLGTMMSSTAVTAIFIPVALRICQRSGTSPSRLMMPLSAAALISGMTTLIATAPNLVVNSELIRQGHTGFHFFAFTPFGAPILVLAIVYMIFARHWLPDHGTQSDPASMDRPSLKDWIDTYNLANREFRLRVTPESSLVGRTIDQVDVREIAGVNILGIERRQGKSMALIHPTAKTELLVDDILLVDLFAPFCRIEDMQRDLALEPMPLNGSYFTDRTQEIGMVEVLIPPDSDLVNATVRDAKFRSRFGLSVIGLKRGADAHDRGLLSEALNAGDTLLLVGPWKAIRRLQYNSRDLVILNLPTELDDVLPVAGKTIQAVACLLLVVGLMVSGVVPNVQAALIGCLLMGALGIVDLESAYRAIDWKTLVLIVGMLPFSLALERTGGVEMGAQALTSFLGSAGIHAVLACIFAVTAILGLFISNTATAVLMAPVALAIAKDMGASPYPFAMIVALAASTAFMTPVSSPVNTLVVTPGNYTFGDFVRVGTPFSLIVMVVTVIMVPWLLPP